MFKCRIEDIDISTNINWNNAESGCMKYPNTIMNQRHLLECKYLSGKNVMLSYIPRYKDLFTGELEEQQVIERKSHETESPADHLNWIFSSCSTVPHRL